MINPVLQTTNNKINTDVKHKNLSIQINLDGFSFCTKNATNGLPLTIEEYSFENQLDNPQELINHIEKIFSTNNLLQQDFKNIEVIHQNNLATLVPTPYFDEHKLKAYLDFNIKTLATDFIAFDDVIALAAKNVYIPYVNVNNYIFQNFGEFEYKHHTTLLIEKLLHKNTAQQTMFVNVSKNNIDIVVTEGKKLLLSNSFQYFNKEDFIYYILFVAEQLQLNTAAFPLVFLGIIKKDSNLYAITYKYVQNIFIHQTNNTTLLKSSKDFSTHSNFILIN